MAFKSARFRSPASSLGDGLGGGEADCVVVVLEHRDEQRHARGVLHQARLAFLQCAEARQDLGAAAPRAHVLVLAELQQRVDVPQLEDLRASAVSINRAAHSYSYSTCAHTRPRFNTRV